MQVRRVRRGVLAAVATLAVVALAGCGTSNSDASVSIKTLQAAAENTQAAESYSFELEETVHANGETVTIKGSGATSDDGKAVMMQLDLPGIGEVEYRFVDGVMYVDTAGSAELSSAMPEGKRWLSIDAEALGGSDFDGLSKQAERSTPSSGLRFLQGLSGVPDDLGTETVNGERTTHYRGRLDYDKLPDSITDDEVKGELAKLGDVPVDVWINGDDEVVKLHMKIDASAFASSSAASGNVEITMSITDIDGPVEVVAPPADEVVDFFSVFGQNPKVV